MLLMPKWVNIIPLGVPVDPDVKTTQAGEFGLTFKFKFLLLKL